MGNEQSGSANGSGGISTSLSFLAGRRSVGNSLKKKAGQVVVVRSGSDSILKPEDDSVLKRFKEIPRFYPVLKSALHQQGLHDPPDVKKKISPRPIFRLSNCFQDYFERCARVVANEQEYIGAKMKDVDYYIATLANKLNARRKNAEFLTLQMEKFREVNAELDNIKMKMADVVSQVKALNEFLPDHDRLPPLDLSHVLEHPPSVSASSSGTLSNNSLSPDSHDAGSLNNLHIEPIEELTVVDKIYKR